MQTQNLTPNRPLRRNEASTYLKEKHGIDRKAVTLAKYASIGGGPRFRLAGRYPIYYPQDLDVWADSITSAPKASTSDMG